MKNWKQVRKGIGSVLLTLVMVAVLLPACLTTEAEAASGTAYTNWSNLKTAMTKNGSGYLNANFYNYANQTITVPAGVTYTLDMNGCYIAAKMTGTIFTVKGTLILINTSKSQSSIYHDSGYEGGNSLFDVVEGGKLYIRPGTGNIVLTGNTACAGVYLDSNSNNVFEMNDKTYIQNCNNTNDSYGGGVYMLGGTFNMKGGVIRDCSAPNGGGVRVKGGTFNMSGGTIQNCTASNSGGGVCVSGGTFKMTNGTIKDNKTADYGGGVYVAGTFNMSGGTISNCQTTATSGGDNGFGGGVYTTSGGTFNMSGGAINGGCYARWGGGVGGYGTNNISGGEISGNKAKNYSSNGSGIYMSSGTTTITGGTVLGQSRMQGGTAKASGYCTINYFTNENFTNNGTKTKITFDKQSGTGGSNSVDPATWNTAMPSATMPTRTGYTFAGYWDATSGGTQYYNANGTSKTNWNKIIIATTLYARWTPNAYTVTLNQQNGTGGTASTTATYAANMTTITKPTYQGFTFLGYFDAATGGTQYYKADGTSAKAWDKTANTTLYAHWQTNSTIDVANETQIVDAFKWAPTNNAAITVNLSASFNVNYALNAGIIEYAGQNIILDLKGYTITQVNAAHTDIIKMEGGTLTLRDSSSNKTGKLTMGGSATSCAAIWVNNAGAVFNFESGTITGCRTNYTGGGITVGAGTLNMSGGIIQNCSASQDGGGVWLGSGTTGTMSGGVIQNCGAYTFGGGLYAGGTFTMSGGVIQNNTLTWTDINKGKGGGIYVAGTTTMTGGYIINNTIARNAGYGGVGVENNQTFNMNGGIIWGNKHDGGKASSDVGADEKGRYYKNGGLVGPAVDLTLTNPLAPIVNIKMTDNITLATNDSIDFSGNQNVTWDLNGKTLDLNKKAIGVGTATTFTLKDSGTGGNITNGYADYGGAIRAFGTIGGARATVIMESGTIRNCSSGDNQYGGGAVYLNNNAHFTMNGGTIKDCTAVRYAGAVRVYNNSSFTMNGGTIQDCKVTSTASDVGKGGAVFVWGTQATFNMKGGEITGCKTYCAVDAGGVGIKNGTFNMSGGILRNSYKSTNVRGTSLYKEGGTVNQTGGYIDPKTTITLDPNHGTAGTQSITVYYGDALTPTIGTLPTRAGYTFAGFDDAGDTVYYDADGKDAGNMTFWDKLDESFTLYAQWTANEYEVVYDANGGGNAPAGHTETYDVEFALAEEIPTKEGYTFDHWNTAQDNSGTSYAAGATGVVNLASGGTATLYAQWSGNTYAIVYKDKDGADFSGRHTGEPPRTHTNAEETTLGSAERRGYEFLGWYEDAECKEASVTSLGAKDYYGEITLYANWSTNNYTVTYTGAYEDTVRTVYGGSVELPECEKPGYHYVFIANGRTFDGTNITSSVKVVVTEVIGNNAKPVVLEKAAKVEISGIEDDDPAEGEVNRQIDSVMGNRAVIKVDTEIETATMPTDGTKDLVDGHELSLILEAVKEEAENSGFAASVEQDNELTITLKATEDPDDPDDPVQPEEPEGQTFTDNDVTKWLQITLTGAGVEKTVLEPEPEQGAEPEIDPESVTTLVEVRSISFDVTPKVTVTMKFGTVTATIPNEAILAPIRFRLPVPDSWADQAVGVVHERDDDSTTSYYEVQGSRGAYYVELASDSFSTFTLTSVSQEDILEGDSVAEVNGKYYTQDEIVDAIKTAISERETLVLLADAEVYDNQREEIERYIAQNNLENPAFEIELNDNQWSYPWDYQTGELAPYTISDPLAQDTIRLLDTTEMAGKTAHNVDDVVTITPTLSSAGCSAVYLKVIYDKDYLQPVIPTGDTHWYQIRPGELKYFDYAGSVGNTLEGIDFTVLKANPEVESITTLVSVVESQYTKTDAMSMTSGVPYRFKTDNKSPAEVKIASIPVDLPAVVEATYKAVSHTAENLSGEGYIATPDSTTGENAGEYSVKLELRQYGIGKYSWPTGVKGLTIDETNRNRATYIVLTIAEAKNSLTVTVGDGAVELHEAYEPTVTADFGKDTAECEYAALGTADPEDKEALAALTTYSKTKPTEAGFYAVRATIPEEAVHKNYEGAVGYGVFEIKKAVITLDAPTLNADKVFDESVRNPGYALLSTEGSVQNATTGVDYGKFYYTTNLTTESTTVPTADTPGTYRVWFKFVPTNNYALAEASYYDWTPVTDGVEATPREAVAISPGTMQKAWFSDDIVANAKPATGTDQSVLKAGVTASAQIPTALTGLKDLTVIYTAVGVPAADGNVTTADAESYKPKADAVWVTQDTLKKKETGKYFIWYKVEDDTGCYAPATFCAGIFTMEEGQYKAFKFAGYLEGNTSAKRAKDKTAKDLVLVFAVDNLNFAYSGKALYDVTSLGYKLETVGSKADETRGTATTPTGGFTKVYAYLTEGADLTKLTLTGTDALAGTVTQRGVGVLDVNENKEIDIGDASTIHGIVQDGTAMTTLISKALLADTNRNGRIDLTEDSDPIRALFIIKTEP